MASNYKTAVLPSLIDPNTGAYVGVVDASGKEQMVITASTSSDQGISAGTETPAVTAGFARVFTRPPASTTDWSGFAKKTGTSGKAAVALRFDDWQNNIISLGLFAELRSRGLFASHALCTNFSANPWASNMTWDVARDWNKNYGIEFWSHGTNHDSPFDANPERWYSNLVREIYTSKSDIEANNLICVGFSMPGVGYANPLGVPGYGSSLLIPSDWKTAAGEMLKEAYPLVETDMTGSEGIRHLPSDLRYGLSHYTISDGVTLADARRKLAGAIAKKHGIQFMTHAGNLGLAGNMTVADWLLFMDDIKAAWDAGNIEFVASSTLPYCDPGSSYRYNFISNGNFSSSIPADDNLSEDNWRGYDGVNRYLTQVTAWDGSTKNVLHCQGTSTVQQVIADAGARNIAGHTMLFAARVRCIQVSSVTTSSVRLIVQDTDNSKLNIDNSYAVDTDWKLIRIPFTPPPNCTKITIAIGRGTTIGSGQVEFDDVKLLMA